MRDRLVWAEINLDHFSYNISSVRKLLSPETKVMAVVKANAYGHGIVPIAKKAEAVGVDYLGVVCLYEARQLRNAGITLPILLLNYTDEESIADAVTLDLRITVMDEAVLKAVSREAQKQHKTVNIHVKVDSGMHRLGLLPKEALAFITMIKAYPTVILEGIFTHFATSDEESLDFTNEQLAQFTQVIDTLKSEGISPPLIHAANSAAVLRVPSTHFTMVRLGKILYGTAPSEEFTLPFIPKPVLTLKTNIIQIRTIPKGDSVGYGRSFVATRETRVAALPIGYADGFRRGPQNFGEVLVCGKRAPIIGRVSMDQSSIDVTDIPQAKVGDEVVIIGSQGNEAITVQEVATQIGTISYEVLASLSSRVTREYIDNGVE